MRFLLDTNVVIALLHDPTSAISHKVRQQAPRDIGISSIVTHELYAGAYKSQRRERNLAVVDGLRFEVVAFDQEDARHAGEISAFLSSEGTPIGAYDVLIAGQARARSLALVTRNFGQFQRIIGLRLADWI